MLPRELAARMGAVKNFEGFQIGPFQRVIGKRLAYTDFTKDGADGEVLLAEKLPPGSRVLFTVANVRTAFAGDTSGALLIGTAVDTDRFSPATDDKDAYVAGVKVFDAADPPDDGNGVSEIESATQIQITIEGAADWDSVSAGEVDVFVVYECLPIGACE